MIGEVAMVPHSEAEQLRQQLLQAQRLSSVGALASEAHLSRSVFAERFVKLAGMSPMQYVTRWRMRLANLWIREDRMALSEIACGRSALPTCSRTEACHAGPLSAVPMPTISVSASSDQGVTWPR